MLIAASIPSPRAAGPGVLNLSGRPLTLGIFLSSFIVQLFFVKPSLMCKCHPCIVWVPTARYDGISVFCQQCTAVNPAVSYSNCWIFNKIIKDTKDLTIIDIFNTIFVTNINKPCCSFQRFFPRLLVYFPRSELLLRV